MEPRHTVESIKKALAMDEFTQGEYMTREERQQGAELWVSTMFKR